VQSTKNLMIQNLDQKLLNYINYTKINNYKNFNFFNINILSIPNDLCVKFHCNAD